MRPWYPGLPVLLAGSFVASCTAPVYEGLGSSASSSGSSSSTGVEAPTSSSSSSTSSTSTASSSSSSSTTDATTAAASTGEPAAPECGDGFVDEGEGCDDGYAANSDDGACTLACQPASCGDGLIWHGHESCDDGPDNNDVLYGGCSTQCSPGPSCDDGIVQGPEECDHGPANGTGESSKDGVPCDGGCRFAAKLVFASSTLHTGGEVGGVGGAHLKCQALAEQAGLDNAANFKAFISDVDWCPATGFSHTTLPMVLPNGIRIADDWDDLILNGPGNGIVVTETGETVLDTNVWTGTNPDGLLFTAQTCEGWTSSSPLEKARIGRTGVDPTMTDEWTKWAAQKEWVSSESVGCWLHARLYCFEQ